MRGVLIYAFNNGLIDYFRQAVWCADRVNHYLNLPVTIVTDDDSMANRQTQHNVVLTQADCGGSRVFNPSADSNANQWFNGNRFQSWDLSPYQETLVLDSDYVVCSDQLLRLFDCGMTVTAMKNVYDVTDRNGFDPYQWISNRRGLHHYWATVIYFSRDQLSQDFFSMMDMIKKNYRHYSELYGFTMHPFRNDFAASVALTAIYGHDTDAVPEIPWNMANVFSDVEIGQINHDTFDFYYTYGKDHKKTRISGQDFHFMNKLGLSKLYAD